MRDSFNKGNLMHWTQTGSVRSWALNGMTLFPIVYSEFCLRMLLENIGENEG